MYGMGGGMGPGPGGNWNSGSGGMGSSMGPGPGPGGMMGGNYGMGGPPPGWGMGYGMLGNMGGPGMNSNQGYGWNNSSGPGGYGNNSGNYGQNMGTHNAGNTMGNNYGGNYTQDGNSTSYGGSYGNKSGNLNSGSSFGLENNRFAKVIQSAPSLDDTPSATNTAMSLSLNLSKQEPSYWDGSGGGNNWQAGKNLTWSESGTQNKSGGQNWQGGNKSWQKKDTWQGGSNNSGSKSWQQKQGQGNIGSGGSGGNQGGNSSGNMSGNSAASSGNTRGNLRGNWNSGTSGGIWSGGGASHGNFGTQGSGGAGGDWSSSGGDQVNQSTNKTDGKSGQADFYWSSSGPTGEEKGEALMEISDEEEKEVKPKKAKAKQQQTQGKKSVEKPKGKVITQKKPESTFTTGTGAGSNSGSKRSEKSKEQETYSCQICDVTVKGLMPYLIHVQGQRHLRAEADKRQKELEKNKPVPRKQPPAPKSTKMSPVPDSRALGIEVTPKPSILRNSGSKRSTDYPLDPPSEKKMGRYDDRQMGPSRNTGRYGDYGRDDPGPKYGGRDDRGPSYGRRDDPVPVYGSSVNQSQQDKPLVFDYGHSKTGPQSSGHESVGYDQQSDPMGPLSASGQDTSGDNQLQHALNTVLSMVQGSALGGMNPLATSIQAAIDNKVQAAVDAQLQGKLGSQFGMSDTSGNQPLSSLANLPPPSSLRSSSGVTKAPNSDPVFVTPEILYPEKPMEVDVKSSGLVKIGEGKFATFQKYMRQTRKEERMKKMSASEASEEKEKEEQQQQEDDDVSRAVRAELAKLGPTKDQQLISSIVSKVVREYMEFKSDDQERDGSRRPQKREPAKSQEQREKEATAATNPMSDKPPPKQQPRRPKTPVKTLPNLVPSAKKKQKPVVTKAAPRRKRTPPAPVRFSVLPVKSAPALQQKKTIVLGDSDSESETATSSGAETSPTATTVQSSSSITTASISSISTRTTMITNRAPISTIPVLTKKEVPLSVSQSASTQPTPPGTDGASKKAAKKSDASAHTKKGKPIQVVGEKMQNKTPKSEKKKKKKSGDWSSGNFDEEFANKRAELDKILSASISKPKMKAERKRSEGAKGDRVSVLKKRQDDFDSSPYEDISDMSDISSDESMFGERLGRRVEVVRRVDRGRGYRDISRSPLRFSPDRYGARRGRSHSLSPRPRRRYPSLSPVRGLRRSPSPRSRLSSISPDLSHRRLTPVKDRLGPRRSRTPVKDRLGGKPRKFSPLSPRRSLGSISPSRQHPHGGLQPRARDRKLEKSISISPERLHPAGGLVPRRDRGRRDLSPLSPPRDRLGSLSPSDHRHVGPKPRIRDLSGKLRSVSPLDHRRARNHSLSRSPSPFRRGGCGDRDAWLSPPRDRLGSLTPSEKEAMARIKPWKWDGPKKKSPPRLHDSRQSSPHRSVHEISPRRLVHDPSPHQSVHELSPPRRVVHEVSPPRQVVHDPSPLRPAHDGSLSPISDDEKLLGALEPDQPVETKRGEDWYEQDEPLLQIPAEKITTAYGALLNVLAPGCVQNENDLVLATEMIAELTQALVVLMEGKVDQEYRDRFIKAADGFAGNHGDHPLVAAFHDASNVAPAIIITLSQQEPTILQLLMQILQSRSDILERVLHSNDQLLEFIKAAQDGKVG